MAEYARDTFQGTVYPVKPKRTFGSNLWEKTLDIARIHRKDGDKLTYIKCFIPELNLDFPKASIFFYFYGLKSNSFVRLSFNQFKDMVRGLEEICISLDTAYNQIKSQEDIYTQKAAEMKAQEQAMLAQIESLKLAQKLSQQTDVDFPDEDFPQED